MSKDASEAAFPLHAQIRPDLDKEWCGMTLRDYFAAKALAGMSRDIENCELAAGWCYRMADAMLAARKA